MADLEGAIFAYSYRIQHARAIPQLKPQHVYQAYNTSTTDACDTKKVVGVRNMF